MVTGEDISIICHLRIDNDLRKKNLENFIAYYRKNIPDAELVLVEDVQSRGGRTKFADQFDIYENFYNPGPVKKAKCYNIGESVATRDIVIFMDIDVIVEASKLLDSINFAKDNNTLECLIGYNGVAFYMSERGELDFIKSEDKDLNLLRSKIEGMPIQTGVSGPDAMVGNTAAVGGCLVMTKESFEKINGFNPFFIGWGYEDNEIISRAHRLGLQVTRSNINDNFLFHLPHSDPRADKSQHDNYKKNHEIIQYVESCSEEALKEYIRKWER